MSVITDLATATRIKEALVTAIASGCFQTVSLPHYVVQLFPDGTLWAFARDPRHDNGLLPRAGDYRVTVAALDEWIAARRAACRIPVRFL